jgi:hypothetical protein
MTEFPYDFCLLIEKKEVWIAVNSEEERVEADRLARICFGEYVIRICSEDYLRELRDR